jgi:hypothetical protein
MNPSFRPPPPLGDEMQEALYREMQSGKKTLGEISAEFNVGRARLDAIRKLKEIEAEYRRQVSKCFIPSVISNPFWDEKN